MIKSLIGVLALVVAVVPTSFGDAPYKSGYATAHDRSNIYFEVHGTGRKYVLFGYQLQPKHRYLPAFVQGLGDQYKLIVAEYPPGEANPNSGDAKMYTFTPAAVASDYLAIATAAGANEFAYYGYSWGAASGLQLAIRTDRMKAFVGGGFSMMDGQYRGFLDVMRAIVLQGAKSHHAPEVARQMLTYYESLQTFDDRAIQSRLRMPRLNFVGALDRRVWPGDIEVDIAGGFNNSSSALKAAGWDVMLLSDKDHSGAGAAEVVVPLLRAWLDKNWTDL